MCGRFTLHSTPDSITEHFGLDERPELAARYNIAPGQPVVTLRAQASDAAPTLALLRWGLVPHWARDSAGGHRMINARAETVADKPAFREALRARRCLIPADGFYEWARASGSEKQPYLFSRPDSGLFAFAGLFDVWHAGDADEVRSCTIVTSEANPVLADIHERMPVILDPRDYARWLDPGKSDAAELRSLLVPCPEALLTRRTVGLRVNDPRNDDAECATPAPPEPRQGELW